MSTIKPILFNTDMVRAILDGKKTVTRRIVKPQPPENARLELVGDRRHAVDLSIDIPGPDDHRIYTPPYLPGDILYVRETWAKPFLPDSDELHYRADYSMDDIVIREGPYPDSKRVTDVTWRPSIHMPKDAARIFLRVTDVRVERLQEITDEGAKAEGTNNGIGVADKMRESAIQRFQKIWDSTIKPTHLSIYGWDVNPYVWVIEFERCEKPEEMK